MSRIKRKIFNCICIAITCLSVVGCGLIPGDAKGSILPDFSNLGSGGNGGGKVSPTTGYAELDIEEGISVSDGADDSSTGFTAATGVDDNGLEAIKSAQEGLYAYSVMDESLHDLYAELVAIIEAESEGVKISTTDSEQLKYVFQCVFNDHPEYYWIDGYSYVRHESGGETLYLTFTGKYTYTVEERKTYDSYIDLYVNKCKNAMPKGADDYEKVKFVYQYIIDNTDYDLEARDNQNILSVFVYGESVCQGYAKAMQYILNDVGVECTMCVGTVITGEGHAWNLVNIDGAYYFCDVTWGDANYIFEGGGSSTGTEDITNYDYLNITTEELNLTHTIDNVVPMPVCYATSANYYVRENVYFDDVDTQQLSDAFTNAYAHNLDSVTLKCSGKLVFDDMYEHLIDDQAIFEYLINSDNVSYSANDEAWTFIFWL